MEKNASKLKLLREFIKISLELRRKGNPDYLNRLEHLKFVGANKCPQCEAELSIDNFRHLKNEQRVFEYIFCRECGERIVLSNIKIN